VGSNGYRRVDGGTGFDTLRIGAATTLDFTAVGSGAGQNLSGHTRGIERIDLVAGAQAGTLRLSEQDVYALAGDYSAPAGAAVAGRQSNTLFVSGDTGDTLSFAEGIGGASGWRTTGLVTANAAGDGASYVLYQRGTASVYVDARMSLADTIAGGAAGETLVGGLGSDAISGGGGNDTLYGGTLGSTPASSQAGVRDVFAWSMQSGLAQGADVVKDFQRGTDRVYLTDVRETTALGGAGLTLRDVTQADSPTQYVTLANGGSGNLRLTFVSGGTSSSVVLEGVQFESSAVANNGRYGSLAELFGTGETRLVYLTADPFGAGLTTLP
jgi:Ca2+-binding RTX toxin-like protein